jgi:hypothetical protein
MNDSKDHLVRIYMEPVLEMTTVSRGDMALGSGDHLYGLGIESDRIHDFNRSS